MTGPVLVPDVARLDQVIGHVEANPDQHSPREWRCGTAMCIAGHTADLAGGRWVHPADSKTENTALLHPEPGDPANHINQDDGYVAVWHRAQRLLRLDTGDAEELFAPSNTLADIKLIRDVIAATAARLTAGGAS